jgi:hypothetical protein
MAITRNDQMRVENKNKIVVQPGHVDIGKAMAEASAPHRPKPTVAKGAQAVPPEGMVKRNRSKLEGQIVLKHGIPFTTRKSLL